MPTNPKFDEWAARLSKAETPLAEKLAAVTEIREQVCLRVRSAQLAVTRGARCGDPRPAPKCRARRAARLCVVRRPASSAASRAARPRSHAAPPLCAV